MKSLIIYHRADYDGLFSMMISRMWLERNSEPGDEVDLFGWNYGDKIPDMTYDIGQKYDRVVMVDISFPTEQMLELMSFMKVGVEVIWIDHHITAINDSITNGYSGISGLRDSEWAATENTWHYFFPSTPTPHIVKLISTYDIFDRRRFDWENEVLPLQFALKAKYSLYADRLWKDWPWMITAEPIDLVPIIESGKLILEYLSGTWASTMKNFSWEVTVGGKYRGIACISTEFSSNVFGDLKDKYDVLVVCNWRPKNEWFSVSMYIDPEVETDFHAGNYLRENYGGGGHKGAAGGHINQDQFLRLINDHEI